MIKFLFRVPIRGSKNNHQTVKINRSRTHCCNLTFDPLKIKPIHKGTINWSKTKIMAPVANASTGNKFSDCPLKSVVICGVGLFLFYYPRNFRAVVLVVSFVDVSHEKRYLWQRIASWIQRHGVDFSIQTPAGEVEAPAIFRLAAYILPPFLLVNSAAPLL